MQDIGGCRAVLQNVADVRELRDDYARSQFKHRFVKENDYISEPKPSGYRGIHRVYRYYSDRNNTYNGLQLEVQMRSQLQHAWATAVETVSTFLRQSLKASQGSEEWLRFFSLMGSAIAIREGEPLVPGTPSAKKALVREIRDHVHNLDVRRTLSAFHTTLQMLSKQEVKAARYYLVELEMSEGRSTVTVTEYTKPELDEATADYLEAEQRLARSGPGSQAVLVSVESVSALRRAYPNYFLDTGVFLRVLAETLSD